MSRQTPSVSTDLSPFIPKKIQRNADLIEHRVGVRPTITEIAPRRWQILLVGPRLELEMIETFRNGKPVKYLYESTLKVDGVERKWVRDSKELGQLWARLHDPDFAEPELPVMPSMPTEDDVPEYMRDNVTKLREMAARIPEDADLEVSIWPDEELGEGRWIIGFNMLSSNSYSRMKIEVASGGSRWRITDTLLVQDGINRSSEAGSTVESMLMAMLKTSIPLAPAPGGSGPVRQGGSAPKVAQQSVRDHKSTVIRV